MSVFPFVLPERVFTRAESWGFSSFFFFLFSFLPFDLPERGFLLERFLIVSTFVGPWLREGEYGPFTSFVPSVRTLLLLSHGL